MGDAELAGVCVQSLSPQPLPVTPRGDAEAATLIEKFKAITDPAEQTAFWRSLSAEKRALILNAK